MTIQKKSLINSLNTTKKAIVASTPASGKAATGTVKPAASKLAMKNKPAQFRPAAIRLAKFQ